MTNNDILRRLRYSFDYDDNRMIKIFSQVEETVSREQISDWLKADDDPDQKRCNDHQMALFLNGLIIELRGKKEGPQPVAEKQLNNNLIFVKLKIALNLKAEDVLDLVALAGLSMSKHELSAFFRKPGHKHFRECKDQILRNFLMGLQLKHRADAPDKGGFVWGKPG